MKLAIVLLLVPVAVAAQPLRVANVDARAVSRLSGAADSTAPIWSGGFLQSRSYEAAGRCIYEYRVDLRSSAAAAATGAVTSITVDFGPNAKLDFNSDKAPDDVFVVTSGGLGSVPLASAIRAGSSITFNFAGGGVARGRSSYFFGIVSSYPKKNVTVTAANTLGAPLSLAAWAPAYPIRWTPRP